MNGEIKREWVAALRSDEFRQGREVLRSDDKYCCLGVLCELHRRAHPGKDWERSDFEAEEYYLGDQFELPVEVMVWAGLKSTNPPFLNCESGRKLAYKTLAELNDAGATFAEIADVIEADL